MALTDYLKLRGRTYYVRVQIPPRLRAIAGGKREFVKTLKTGDLREANKLKHAHVASFQGRIRALERVAPDTAYGPLAEIHEKALSLRYSWEKVKDEAPVYPDFDPEQPYYPSKDATEDVILGAAREIADNHGDDVAAAFLKIAKGEATRLGDVIETWLAEQAGAITEQTVSHHRVAVRALFTWAGQGVLVEDVNRKMAGDFVSHLLKPESGLSPKTVKRYLSSLSSLWSWLEARGQGAQDNPWLRQGVAKKAKRGQAAAARKQWTDAALVKVLRGSYTPQYTVTLHDLVKLALVTGARIEELCALQTVDVHHRAGDGWWITIGEGKTEAAVREVPIHDSAAHVIERRRKSSTDGFLFHELVNRRPIGTPDRHPKGTPSSYVSND
jgi:site-specific recombinase XerD